MTPHATRRETPLAQILKARIRATGPLPVSAYMGACLHDPVHGYYVTRDAIGRKGDFITAPEISQTFGELIGLWSAVVWQQMGSGHPLQLVEFGPGHGTLMRDLIRVIQRVPGLQASVNVGLVEPGDRMRTIQADALGDSPVPVRHLDAVAPFAGLPEGPVIVIANEVLDCFPVEQFVLAADGAWRLRTVILDENGALSFGLGDRAAPPAAWIPAGCTPGCIVEVSSAGALIDTLAPVASQRPCAALLIDYGHAGVHAGDTLQAVRSHAYEHPLAAPGEADLTAQVSFAQVEARARATGLAVDGPITQAEFLGRLGIIERASRLMAANPSRAGEIEAGVLRLMAPNGMGTRFKAIGLRSPSLPPLPGF